MLECKTITVDKKSDYLIGKMLTRGYNESGKPFFTNALGNIGNIRNAMSFLTREGMSLSLLSATRLNKRQISTILGLPKRKANNYDEVLLSVINDRIVLDKSLVKELLKFERDGVIAVIFAAPSDGDGETLKYMDKYCKMLNTIVSYNKEFVSLIKTQHNIKEKRGSLKIVKKKNQSWLEKTLS